MITIKIVKSHIPGCQKINRLNWDNSEFENICDVPHPIAAMAPRGAFSYKEPNDGIIWFRVCQLWWIAKDWSWFPLNIQQHKNTNIDGIIDKTENKKDLKILLLFLTLSKDKRIINRVGNAQIP